MVRPLHLRSTLRRRSSTQIKLPDKLYDRQNEMEVLLERFRATCADSLLQNEIVLITGASGVGKTALANTLRSYVIAESGYFLTGKFDSTQQSSEGFSAFCQAITDYVHQAMERNSSHDEKLKEWVHKATSGNPHLLTDAIPSLRNVLGLRQTSHSSPFGMNSRASFHRVFCNFLAVLCSPEHPIVILLDDLQWAHDLDLLESILTDPSISGLMVIGTCRGNEVALDDDLSVMLRKLEDAYELNIVEIRVGNLSKRAVQRIVEESMELETDLCATFASLVFARTGGNVFFTIHFLQSIARDGIPTDDGELKLNLSRFKVVDPVGLLSLEIQRQPAPIPDLLKATACLGTSVDRMLLHACVENLSEDDFMEAEMAGLLIPSNDNQCAFAHDKIHEASNSLIPVASRLQYHSQLAQLLLKNLSKKNLQTSSVVIAGLLARCLDLIVDEDQRHLCASILFDAGKKVAKSSSFHIASMYFQMGRDSLPSRPWLECYDLTLQLFSFSAEIEYVIGNIDQANTLIDEVLEHAASLSDRLPVHMTRIYLLASQSEFKESLDIAFGTLRELGESFPQKVTYFHIALELIKTRRVLRTVELHDIVDLPIADDPQYLTVMIILNMVYATCFFYPPYNKHGVLVALRMIQNSIILGITQASSVAFAMYSIYLSFSLDKLEEASRYGNVALGLLDRFQAKEWTSRVFLAVHGNIAAVFRPPEVSVDLLMSGHRAGLVSGDIEVSLKQ